MGRIYITKVIVTLMGALGSNLIANTSEAHALFKSEQPPCQHSGPPDAQAIATAQDFSALRNNRVGEYYVLCGNIDLMGLAESDLPEHLDATLDGNGFLLKGLPGPNSPAPTRRTIFQRISSTGVVRNVRLGEYDGVLTATREAAGLALENDGLIEAIVTNRVWFDVGSGADYSCGLVGANQGTIRDVTVSSFNSVGQTALAAGVVCKNYGVIENVKIDGIAQGAVVGGVASRSEPGSIIRNSRSFSFRARNAAVSGGLVGEARGANLQGLHYSATSAFTCEAGSFCGGIVGIAREQTEVSECALWNRERASPIYSPPRLQCNPGGTLSGNGAVVGGIVGALDHARLEDSFVVAQAADFGHSHGCILGALVGLSTDSTVVRSHAKMSPTIVSGSGPSSNHTPKALIGLRESTSLWRIFFNRNSGLATTFGTGLTDEQYASQSTFQNLQFPGVWVMSEHGYPALTALSE